jgi:hypothetical protein
VPETNRFDILAPATAMQRAVTEYHQRVCFNIVHGLDSDYAREEAIALFRAAACILPAEPR